MVFKISNVENIYKEIFLAIIIDEDIIKPYLNELKDILGQDKYDKYTDNLKKRNLDKFLLVVIDPDEYKMLCHKIGISIFVNSLEKILNTEIDDLKMLGIGVAEKNEDKSYYIVCKSDKLDEIRNIYNLPPKDFHITLGFNYNDVFGVRKNLLLKKTPVFLKKLKMEYLKKRNWEFVKNIQNFDLNVNDELIPIELNDRYIKFKCGDYCIDVSWLDDIKDFYVLTKYYDDKKNKKRLPTSYIYNIFKNI